MKILISNSAFSDLENIKDYYNKQGVAHIGVNIIAEILLHIETLEDHPNIGRVVPEFDENSIREIIHAPYRVVYLLEDNLIHIIRVWRSERLLNFSLS